MMKKSVMTCALVLLVCFGLTSSAGATTVDANQEWVMGIEPSISITCVSYFIPDVPNVPDSLIFAQLPEWTNTVSFDYNSAGWDTALTDGGKTAYLFGSELTNSGLSFLNLFSYKLYYQWGDEDVVDYPVYLDVVVFYDDEVVYNSSRWGEPGSYEGGEAPLDGPYDNPIPEPMTICLLGLGTALLRKKRRRKTLSLYKLQ